MESETNSLGVGGVSSLVATTERSGLYTEKRWKRGITRLTDTMFCWVIR